ncbi:MAG: DUF2239 family protein [Alphaproteobacteria bacterium]|nr:DUF2239 family protein [Alphaproteobacteria bacterium]
MTAASPAVTLSAAVAIAFEDGRLLAAGSIADVALAVKLRIDQAGHHAILVFEHDTGQTLHLDLRGGEDDIRARFRPPAGAGADAGPEERAPTTGVKRGPGRPRLGVVAREVTLLPRHWDWLGVQPGGASVALRKLVEDARKTHGQADLVRASQEAAYRFMAATAGDRPFYEDVTRALFSRNAEGFNRLTDAWPEGIRDHARRLAAAALEHDRSG